MAEMLRQIPSAWWTESTKRLFVRILRKHRERCRQYRSGQPCRPCETFEWSATTGETMTREHGCAPPPKWREAQRGTVSL